MTEDETDGWHHLLNRHEFEQTPGEGDRLGSLVGCCPWGVKEADSNNKELTEQQQQGTTQLLR